MDVTVEYIYEAFDHACVRNDELYYRIKPAQLIRDGKIYKVNAAHLKDGKRLLTFFDEDNADKNI